MNDFTKEELENILLHMSISVGEDAWDEDSINIPGLYTKVTSMIDNYCEHEKDGRVYNGVLGLSFKCLKCNRFIC